MSNYDTVAMLINNISNKYMEKKPALSERDFLMDLAEDESFYGCNKLGCGFRISKANDDMIKKSGQDAFIDYHLGKRGTVKRELFEMEAGLLLGVARRYRHSTAPSRLDANTPYNFETKAVQALFDSCRYSQQGHLLVLLPERIVYGFARAGMRCISH